eukprot:NODE_130_length_18488_cov_0.389961.p9 type:complete len:164 gc:universal NODE_130_length_18488_cov_0.389961:16169-16660(+)
MKTARPINLLQFIKNNPFMPPINNRVVQQDQLMVMLVQGPNKRTDYHVNPTNEWFYQLKGDLVLKIIEDNSFKDLVIKQGESYLLHANIPHSPQRVENSLGLVIEMVRPENMLDSLQWYCNGCKKLLQESKVRVNDLNVDLLKPINEFTSKKQKCPDCNTIHN